MSLLDAVTAKPEAFGPYGGKVEMNDGKNEVSARAIIVGGIKGQRHNSYGGRPQKSMLAALEMNAWRRQ